MDEQGTAPRGDLTTGQARIARLRQNAYGAQ